jgi:hypothetical protein
MIDLPAQPPGGIRFTCGMGRYRGHIEIVDDRRAPIVARLCNHAKRLEAPLRRAAVLWICSLPPIALVAILGLDPAAATAAAGMALVAWAAGCLWVFRSWTNLRSRSRR